MKLHEYQAKDIFRENDIPTMDGITVTSATEAVQAAEKLGLPVVLKAQVQVGGRGKAGGIRLIREMSDVKRYAADILNMTIKDLPVRRLLVTSAVDIESEAYLSLLLDRNTSSIMFIGCADGGIEIEETAKNSPEKILRMGVAASRLAQLTPEDCLPLASKLFEDEHLAFRAAEIMVAMARMFKERDCSLIEINPLIVDSTGSLIALDAKVIMDDNALFRQPENVKLRDLNSQDAGEAPSNGNLSFVRLDGNIGCMVNGAGLAMATMDIVKHYGGSPANFLDAGGSSDPQKVISGLKLILEDKNVKVVLINIFGGITRCDDIVKGILEAREQFNVPVPIVLRLAGTNEAEGRALLNGTRVIPAESLEEGALEAIEIGRAA